MNTPGGVSQEMGAIALDLQPGSSQSGRHALLHISNRTAGPFDNIVGGALLSFPERGVGGVVHRTMTNITGELPDDGNYGHFVRTTLALYGEKHGIEVTDDQIARVRDQVNLLPPNADGFAVIMAVTASAACVTGQVIQIVPQRGRE